MHRKRKIALALLAILTLSAVAWAFSYLLQRPLQSPAGDAPPPPQALQLPANSSAQLAGDEVGRALSIALQDPEVGSVLAGANWSLAEAGAWLEAGEKVGAALLIRLSEPVWVSGNFRDTGGKTYRASLWLGSLHVLVDFREGRVAVMSPGMARAPTDPPVASEKVEEARRVAQAWVRDGRAAYLNAIFYTEEYQSGLAVFRVEHADGEDLVAVNLATMAAEERWTG